METLGVRGLGSGLPSLRERPAPGETGSPHGAVVTSAAPWLKGCRFAVWDRERKRPLSFHRDREVAVIQMGVDRAGASCGKVDCSTDLDVVLWGYGRRGPASRAGL